MRRVLLCLTCSLDGFIADEQGGIDWLAPEEPWPADLEALLAKVDALLMGRATYETSLTLRGGTDVFAGKQVYVCSRTGQVQPLPGVTVVREDAVAFTWRLKHSEGGVIWLYGGGQLATTLSDASLVDEYIIALQPILLGKGIPLWRTPHARTQLTAGLARLWPSGVVELRYGRRN